jgi:hypothetical protein
MSGATMHIPAELNVLGHRAGWRRDGMRCHAGNGKQARIYNG